MNQLTLINQVKELKNTLATIKPNNSETTQLITYTLVGAALVGIMVYHYIKSQETL
jgi:flagellar hook assembly protein FlgD